MILTLTPNPSIDATVRLNEALEPGAVHRAESVSSVAGGKGVNVTHAVTLANVDSLALLPAAPADPFLALADDASIPVHAVHTAGAVRTNTTLTEPDGRTTKLNGPGPTLDESVQQDVAQAVAEHCANAEWIVMAGSLPKGVPTDWYTQLITVSREANPNIHVAVDTSDAPMVALGENLEVASPDLIKPNGLELGQLANVDGQALEAAAENGDFSGVVEAARVVVKRGIPEVLVTLGVAGAVLVTAEEAWAATPPPITLRSTVGAGDSSLSGYILARRSGASYPEALRQAVAYGSAAAALPGTQIPTPEELDIEHTTVQAVTDL
ncbi:1-phosphofructokinase family hexose kinase [Corynebacterium hiratae]|uniref:1-phosphofructokinase n=1 Tax=Corynebacterium aurimucosum TaxID=169292 RepID=A0A6I3K9G2_9CORY|nr:1-phosphofructokinase [Corynebacterium aurimucosum]MTD91354.1 1-phosphofructokinase [Corynebacterium aurimucosum]